MQAYTGSQHQMRCSLHSQSETHHASQYGNVTTGQTTCSYLEQMSPSNDGVHSRQVPTTSGMYQMFTRGYRASGGKHDRGSFLPAEHIIVPCISHAYPEQQRCSGTATPCPGWGRYSLSRFGTVACLSPAGTWRTPGPRHHSPNPGREGLHTSRLVKN